MIIHTITYKPGRTIPVADTLSRAPVYNPSREELVHTVYEFPIRDELLNKIRHETTKDDASSVLGQVISKGWPDHKDLIPENIRAYFSYRDELTVSDGIVMRGSRVVIPDRLRKEMKQRIYKGHMRSNSCLRFAKDIIYWPQISSEIRQFVETCGTCATYSQRQARETPIITTIPERPWEKVGTDIFFWAGKEFLVMFDYYSNFIEYNKQGMADSESVVSVMNTHFARYGVPCIIVSDNGPQFAPTLFRSFAEC